MDLSAAANYAYVLELLDGFVSAALASHHQRMFHLPRRARVLQHHLYNAWTQISNRRLAEFTERSWKITEMLTLHMKMIQTHRLR